MSAEIFTSKLRVKYPTLKPVSVRTIKSPIPIEEMEPWERKAWFKGIAERPEVLEFTEAGTFASENLLDIQASKRKKTTIGTVHTGGLWEVRETVPTHVSIMIKMESGDKELSKAVTRAARNCIKEETGKKPFCVPSIRRIDCSVENEVPVDPKLVDDFTNCLGSQISEELKVTVERI